MAKFIPWPGRKCNHPGPAQERGGTQSKVGSVPDSVLISDNSSVHWHFIRYVMSDVYALVDFLSGRAKPSLTMQLDESLRSRQPSGSGIGRSTGQSDAESAVDGVEFPNHTLFFSRIMRIGNLASKGSDISDLDAAFLIEARDRLNIRAKPATGNSIVFTLRVIEKLRPMGQRARDDPQGARYYIQDPIQENAAERIAHFVNRQIKVMIGLLIVTVLLSTYVACIKLLLDTRDQVNRDIGANFSAIAATMGPPPKDGLPTNVSPTGPPARKPLSETSYKYVGTYCLGASSYLADQSCTQQKLLETRKRDIHELLTLSTPLVKSGIDDDEEVEQWAIALVGVLGNYLLPVLYGALGTIGYVLRRLNGQLADYLVTPRELRASQIRIALGIVTGACIGLFVNSSAGPATVSGMGGAAVTLSASGVAFLAGYGVEGVFKMLDWLIGHIFKIGQDQKDESHA
jgi:hypothetical protein